MYRNDKVIRRYSEPFRQTYSYVCFCFNLYTYMYKILTNEKQEKTTHRTIRSKTG